MPDWRLIRHPFDPTKLLTNEFGIPLVYDAEKYPDGPPPECCCPGVNCPCCPSGTPRSWDVTFDNVGDGADETGCCDDNNATFNVPQAINEETGEPDPCLWRTHYMACEETTLEFQVTCNTITNEITVTVTAASPSDTAVFQKTFPPNTSCFDLTGNIPKISGGLSNCNWTPATCSIAPG